MTKVLVSGASGLLATHTIIELIKKGYFVKALVRDKKKILLPHLRNLEILEGDINDKSSLELACKDCEIVVHTAAETNQGWSNYSHYSRVNIQGTENILKASIKNGVSKFIHISTCNVYGYGDIEDPGSETKPIKKPFSDSLYVKSKLAAQQIALSYSDKIDVIVINPTFIIGSYDQKPSSGRIVLLGSKKIVFVPPGGKNFVGANDVAHAILQSITHGKNRESYILSGENMSYKDFFNKVGQQLNKKPILLPLPSILLNFIGVFGSLLQSLGIDNEFTLTNMKILSVKNYYTNKKAIEALKIKIKNIDIAIEETVEWFKKYDLRK